MKLLGIDSQIVRLFFSETVNIAPLRAAER